MTFVGLAVGAAHAERRVMCHLERELVFADHRELDAVFFE